MSKLKKYQNKRDFDLSPEPSGRSKIKKSKENKGIFIIQKHDASHLHYDFRLEIEGALASWAIPKKPSTDPKEKRLAIETEDHPLDYADFEGTIPEGEYGAGKVTVWDKGKYVNIRTCSMLKSKKEGKIKIFLNGKKLKGNFALIRAFNDEKPKWLFMKIGDKYANARLSRK